MAKKQLRTIAHSCQKEQDKTDNKTTHATNTDGRSAVMTVYSPS